MPCRITIVINIWRIDKINMGCADFCADFPMETGRQVVSSFCRSFCRSFCQNFHDVWPKPWPVKVFVNNIGIVDRFVDRTPSAEFFVNIFIFFDRLFDNQLPTASPWVVLIFVLTFPDICTFICTLDHSPLQHTHPTHPSAHHQTKMTFEKIQKSCWQDSASWVLST